MCLSLGFRKLIHVTFSIRCNLFQNGLKRDGEAVEKNQKQLCSLDIFQLGCGLPADQS